MKKLFLLLSLAAVAAVTAAETENQLVIHAEQGRFKIDRNIYGHFAEHLGRCIYEGFWVGENSPIPNTRGIRRDVVEALKKIKVPVLRWPGGCFADEYHWKDGVGPREQRPRMVNTHWGKVVENNHFGTHEFMDLCEQLQCEPYICGNVGSGTVLEMQQWVEYLTFDGESPMADWRRRNGRDKPWGLRYFGVGNENWGCGGNMTPEYYANEYKRYATYVRNFGTNRIFKIACGPNSGDTNWTEVVMREAGRRMDGLALHYYCGSGRKSRSATQFAEDDWIWLLRSALRMDQLITAHSAIMDKYDPKKRVALIVDEWGTWHAVEPGTNPGFLYQQNTLRDALVAALTFHIFHQHCERVRMANIAQTVNVLQAMVLTDGPRMLLTPTYHIFEMYTVHHDATLLPVELKSATYALGEVSIPAVSASASRQPGGAIHLSLVNTDPHQSARVLCAITGAEVKEIAQGRVLTAAAITAHNTFDQPEAVKPAAFHAWKKTDAGWEITLPPKSVAVVEMR
ncbi:alpha-N-arabinofuranosidase [Fontisphaera persica]|uniref:alpha-N-arabinofuranosidase n=1 Tax=Fontisphaera persica TaxID=2974023 RepID=UPI0024BF7CDA|nr:alpha-N-arabinofuranosidase [Fontisphaera persica]WCJ58944.1 alpha-N-arabinofuranosidase [Fontisphaera persica]